MNQDLAWVVERARTLVSAVPDPEIPVISIADLGILRSVQAVPHGAGFVVEVTITPTYSGCPAMDQIRDDILAELDAHDIPARVRTVLTPAWTTDWMSEEGKAKLKAYGIAPPQCKVQIDTPVFVATNSINTLTDGLKNIKNMLQADSTPIPCPRCDSIDTVEVSHFGSTACKSQLRCLHCKEPFDYFKPY